MASRRTWFVWHSWIGLTTGLLLFVVCWSGTVAVFSREIDLLLDPALRATGTGGEVAWQAIYDSVRAARPGWTIGQINAPYAPGFAAEAWVEDPEGITHRIYADPATGALTGAASYFNVQRFFRSLHMSLFIGELPVFGIPLGYLIVGLLSFPLLASLVTSLVFYKRFWRGFFKLQTHRGAKVFWSDLHKLTGLWGLWFVAMIGLTGVWYLVEWKAPEALPGPTAPAEAETPHLPIDTLVEATRAAYPELEVRTIALYELRAGLFEAQGQDGTWLVRDRAARAWIDARDGSPISIQRARDLSPYLRWIDTADPLHFGNFAGLWGKIIWFAFGLALSGLALTGAYLQAQRQGRQQGPPALRRGVAAAYGVTILILLLATVFAYRELLTYGPSDTLPQVPTSVIGFIGLWLLSTVVALSIWMRAVR